MALDSVNISIPAKAISGRPDVGLLPMVKPGGGISVNVVVDFSHLNGGPKVGLTKDDLTADQLTKLENVYNAIVSKAKAKIEGT